MKEKIKEIKNCANAYLVANNYDYIPDDESSYDENLYGIKYTDIEEWCGLRPDEIAGRLIDLIEKL